MAESILYRHPLNCRKEVFYVLYIYHLSWLKEPSLNILCVSYYVLYVLSPEFILLITFSTFSDISIAADSKATPWKILHTYVFCFFFLAIFWSVPAAYGGSQARGRAGAGAAGLHQCHSNSGSEPHLQLTPQLTAIPDP